MAQTDAVLEGDLSGHRARALADRSCQASRLDAGAELAAHVAHDLGFLLSVVLSNIERLGTAVPETHRPLLDEARKAGASGVATLADLAAFAAQAELRYSAVDPRVLLDQLAGSLRDTLPAGVELMTSVGGPVGVVSADAEALRRVISGIVHNACEAMPEGGRIHLEASDTWLGSEHQETHAWVAPGHYVCLTIGDTGVGMDAQAAHRLYEPFYTTKAKRGRAGLGMAVAYGLVRQHRGMIAVSSEPGMGTTVRIYLPVAAEL